VLADTVFSVDALVRGMMILGGWSAVDRLDQIHAPCLVLVGRHDIPTSWQQSERIARRIPGSEVVVLEDSGHFPWLEEPERFFAALQEWLAKLP
jgi:proline iminopeptidase